MILVSALVLLQSQNRTRLADQPEQAPEVKTSGEWLQAINRYRVEDRPVEVALVAQRAMEVVPPAARISILRAWTLGVLARVPESEAGAVLKRRIRQDPGDTDARVALIVLENEPGFDRIGPLSPPLDRRLQELEALWTRSPEHPSVLAAFIEVLLESGDVDRADHLLEHWPSESSDDPRCRQLRARFALEFDQKPGVAAELLQERLATLPHDWRSRALLARALEALDRHDAARLEAARVDRDRARLEPVRLEAELAGAFEDLNDPSALHKLATLCGSLGLMRLADNWRALAERAD